jgi:hypothetical protein
VWSWVYLVSGPAVSIVARFIDALVEGEAMEPELLPARLVSAWAGVLPVDGAGLSMIDALRIPLGASRPEAALAERAQITLGEGPCLSALEQGRPVVAGYSKLLQTWPAYGAELTALTPFRSAASIPIGVPGQRFGALDLYCVAEEGTAAIDLEHAQQLADITCGLLLASPEVVGQYGIAEPAYLATGPAQERMTVWQAIGMLIAATSLQNSDALAVLRASAYSHQISLDQLASELTSSRIRVEDVLGS